MKINLFVTASVLALGLGTKGQNIGIGTPFPTENLHVVGNRTLFQNNYVGIGTGNPVSGFTSFQINKNENTFGGMYVNTGLTGTPFYGYALNGSARSYTSYNPTANQFEYHQSNDGTADFLINGNAKAVFNTAFVGIGANTPTTPFTGFALKSSVNNFFGAYIDAGPTGTPFYGYALNGNPVAFTTYNGATSQYEYYHTSNTVPDLLISNTHAAFPNSSFLGIGTSTPSNIYTGITLKKNVNNFWGMYIDAGVSGKPFYGYALSGNTVAFTQYNGSNNHWELSTNNNIALSVAPGGNVGIGVTPPKN